MHTTKKRKVVSSSSSAGSHDKPDGMHTKKRKVVSSSSSSSSHDKPGSEEPDDAVGAGGEVVADAGHAIGDDAILAEVLHEMDDESNDEIVTDWDAELFGDTPGLFP